MAFPLDRLSQVAVHYDWLGPEQQDPSNYTDTDIGGVGLNDNSLGLAVQMWTFTAVDKQIFAQGENTEAPILLITQTDRIQAVRGTFDQNMNPMVAYSMQDQWYYWWFDATIQGMRTSLLPVGVNSCVVAFDDRRTWESGLSDILIFYTLNASLYHRRQRDRYGVDILLREAAHATILRADMNKVNRMQLKMEAERL